MLIQKEYRNASYPLIFPDLDDPLPIYTMALRSESVTEETKELMTQAWTEYRGSYDKLCESWRECNEKAMEDMARFRGIVDQKAMSEQMRRFRDQRWKKNAEAVARIKRNLIGDDPKLMAAIRDYETTLRARATDYEHDSYPGW